ncbi:MAG: hypothetical protein LUF33_06835, partial [Clostridiales bacterium]|nr:hypothetical protein [Clostridiales bacterium]
MSAQKQTAKKSNTKKQAASRQASSKGIKPYSDGRDGARREKAPSQEKSNTLSPRVRAILFGTAAAVFLVLIFVKGVRVWSAVRGFFFGVFGVSIFLIPVFLIYLAVITEKEQKVAHFKAKMIISAFIILFVGSAIYVGCGADFKDTNYFACLGKLYMLMAGSDNYMTFGCGLIGGVLGYPLAYLCGNPVAMLLSLIAVASLLAIITKITLKDIAAAASRKMNRVREVGEERAKARRERRQAEKKIGSESDEEFFNQYGSGSQTALSRIDIPLDEPKKGKRSRKKKAADSGIDIDISETDEQHAAANDLSQDLLNNINRASKPLG